MLSLTATELQRFMECNGSIYLEKINPVNIDRTVADEGDAAHWFIEQVFKGNNTQEELINKKAPNGVFITEEMVDNCQEYLNAILNQGSVEIDTSHNGTNWQIRGRADHIYNEENKLYISDFKYGWRIVEPKVNYTLISHAIGWLRNNGTNNIDTFIFRIYQPRPYHPEGYVREWMINLDELINLCDSLDYALNNPINTCKTGLHCYKCPSITNCIAAQKSISNCIDTADKAFNSEVNNIDLSKILDEIKKAIFLLEQNETAYIDLATARIKKGEIINNYCLQNNLGRTRWKDTVTPELLEGITGKTFSKKTLITPNQAEKAGVSKDVINMWCETPNKGIKLARVETSKQAEKLFKNKGVK